MKSNMPRRLEGPTIFRKGRRNVPPLAEHREVHNIVDLRPMPLVFNDGIFIGAMKALDLYSEIAIVVGDDEIGLFSVIDGGD